MPRVIEGKEWERVEKGLAQRIAALSAFLDDMYGEQRILRSRLVEPDLILGAKSFLPKLRGLKPPGGVRIHIAGIDLIRSPDGVFRASQVLAKHDENYMPPEAAHAVSKAQAEKAAKTLVPAK